MASYMIEKEKLEGEYKEAFERVEAYAMLRGVDSETQEDRLMNLVDLLLTAQVEELFSSVMPSASAIMHMLFAVVIEVQPPQMPQECSIRPLYSSMSIRPLAAVPTLSCAWICRTSLPLWIPSGM